MDATQMIDDSIYESEEEENEDDNEKREPLAKLRILKNEHVPQTELPLYLGENVLGRDPSICTLPLPARSVSKRHTTICISVFRPHGHRDAAVMEALVWDMGSMNGTRKGYIRLSPHVRYALSEGDRLVVADIPCQYVSCAADKISKQEDVRSPVNKHSEKRVNRDSKVPAMALSPNQEETKKTAEIKGLSFERTPAQPKGTLVPESDSDSEGEQGTRKDRRLKAVVSDSESHASNPTCSSFLSPTNIIIPESEDESPITPSSSTKNRSKNCVSFSEEEKDMDVGRHQLKKERAQVIVDDSAEEEDGREKEQTAPGEREPEKSGRDVPVKQANAVRLSKEDGLPVSTTAISLDVVPVFKVDNDTDVEGEEEEERAMSAGPATLNESQTVDHSKYRAQFHMDSDTDVDEDADALNNVNKSVPASYDCPKHTNSLRVVQSTAINLESDTDVDDDDCAAVSGTAARATTTSLQNASTADTAPFTLSKDFHVDSDTDVDEKDDYSGAGNTEHSATVEKTPHRTDPGGVEPTSTSHNLHLDSDTDDELMSGHNRSKLTAADTGADLESRSDSDTDLEEDAPQPPPIIAMATKLATLPAKALSVTSAAASTSTARLTDSDADTDVKESDLALHTWALADPVNFMLDSDTDVDEEAGEAEEGEGRVSCLSGGKDLGSPLVLASTQRKCSLRSELSAPLASSMRLVASSPSSDSQENDDVVIAETQSFILESRGHQASLPDEAMHLKLLPGDEEDRQALSGGSLQLGLSDSSHLQLQAQALAMENTQAFVPIDGDVNLGSVQECGNNPPADRNSVEDSDIEANKAYEGNGESASKSDGFGNEKQLDFALQATQPYLLEPCEEEERINKAATAETQQFFFPPITTLAMAETQPMSASGEEGEEKEDLVGVKSSTVCQISRKQNEGEERDETDDTIQAEEGLTSSDISTAETQPLDLHDAEESDDEDSVPVVRKRKAKPLRPVEEEESQLIPGSEPSDADTQPMFTHDNKEEEDEKIIKPLSTKRKGRSQSGKPELSTSTHTSTAKTKPEAAEEAKANKQRATGRPQRGKGGRESDAGTSSSSWGGRLVRGIRLGKEEEQGKPSELPKKQTTGKGKSLFSTRGRRGEIRPEEEVEDSKDEKVRQAKRGKKPTKRRGNEQEERERKEEEGVEMEQQEQAVKDRLLKEQERSERALKEQEERERLEEERKVMEERERIKQREQERLDREKAEREEERLEREERERMERERKELQKMEREKKEREEIERLERKELEERERLERERKEREETERMERERKEREETERLEREMKKEEMETLERERKEREEIERKELEKREILEREKKKREEQERKEQEQQARQREKNEKEERERLEKEKKQQEREVTEKGLKEQKAKDEEHKPKASKRVSRAARRSVAAATEAEPELDLNISNSDGVPARRTRSRSNSASSERSASGVTALQSKGRGRGRGAKTTSQPVPEITTRHSNRRCTVAGDPSAERGTTEQKTDDNFPPGVLSRSNSLNAEPSGYSPSSQSRGKRGRGRKRASEPEEDSIPAVDNQNDHSPAPKATARGRKSQKVDSSSDVSPQIHKEEKACFQQPGTTRGRKRGSANDSEHAAAVTDEEDQRAHNLDRATKDSFLPQSNVKSKGRGQKAETIMIPVTALFTDEHEAKENGRQKGRKRELEEMVGDEEGESSRSKISRGKANARGRRTEATAAEEEERKSEAKEVKPAPAPASRGGRASTTQGRRNAKEPFAGEEVKKHTQTMEVEIVDGRFEGTQSVTHTKKADREEGGTTSDLVSMDRDASSESPEVPQTPTGKASNKRAAPMGSSPVAKTPRTPSASPRATSRIRAFKQSYKVLFTGVTDEAGENVVGRLGGSLATGVADVTHLVTDKVRRTVKFLCAMARGVPIVTTDWLVKCGKAGSFLCPDVFIVNDKEQEKKFNFCLEKSLRIASSQPLLQGYNIHVTKSVKPEPVHMKDIICCSGATFLPKMPSSHKAQTIVISCEEDWSLCGPALAASLPVVTAEFLLTGILQQKIDFETHSLPAPTIQPQAVGGRGRGRKKS